MPSTYGRAVAAGLLILVASAVSPAPNAVAFHGAYQSPAPGRARDEGGKRWEATERLILAMQCMADATMIFEFPGLSLRAEGFEIMRSESPGTAGANVGNVVQLAVGGRPPVPGEAIAYALSVRRLDANLAFIFDRTGLPVSAPSWKRPKIAMLLLTQDKANPKRFTLEPAPGDTSQFKTVSLSCERALAERAPGRAVF